MRKIALLLILSAWFGCGPDIEDRCKVMVCEAYNNGCTRWVAETCRDGGAMVGW